MAQTVAYSLASRDGFGEIRPQLPAKPETMKLVSPIGMKSLPVHVTAERAATRCEKRMNEPFVRIDRHLVFGEFGAVNDAAESAAGLTLEGVLVEIERDRLCANTDERVECAMVEVLPVEFGGRL